MKGKSKIQLALWALLFMVAIPISAYGVDGQIKIAQTAGTTFPITINEPGSYVLTSNLMVTTGNAINIDADNVTLDLNGHGIYGPGTGYGIYARNQFNITIKNGIVRGFRYNGIYLNNDADHQGAGHRIEGIQASNNSGYGIFARYSTVTNCTANNNGDYGIYAYDSTVTNCTANNNGASGICASDSTVTNCTANDNDRDGIYAYDSTVTNCTANYNDSDGIYASRSTVTNCTAYNNGSCGITAYYSTATNCTANYNGSDGIYAYRSTVTNCTAYNNGDFGTYASKSTVTNCTANYNGSDGIYAFHSAVKGCNVRENTGYGISMSSGSHNYIYRNAASGNTAGQINCPSGNTCVDNATF